MERQDSNEYFYTFLLVPGGCVVPLDKFFAVFLFTYPVPGVVPIYPPVVREPPREFRKDQTVGTLVDLVPFLRLPEKQGVLIHRQSFLWRDSKYITA